jgi:hypothetical protein
MAAGFLWCPTVDLVCPSPDLVAVRSDLAGPKGTVGSVVGRWQSKCSRWCGPAMVGFALAAGRCWCFGGLHAMVSLHGSLVLRFVPAVGGSVLPVALSLC